MSTPAQRLGALPKSALVELALRLASERNLARAEADAAKAAVRSWKAQARSIHDYHFWTAHQVRDIAQAELDATPPDPDAAQHIDDLAIEIDAYTTARRPTVYARKRTPGPRCHKGHPGNFCGKPLDEHGLCSRHDARQRKALRDNAQEAAA